MPSWLGAIIKDPEKRAILSWLGGGTVVVAGGIWTVLTFVVEHEDASHKKGGTNITVSGQGIASGGNTNVGGNVTIGPSKEQIEQIQKPLAEQLGQKDAQIAALTKMLLEKNPAAASGPGAQQAIGAAVASITQGAQEGDSRLEKALGLLKENKLAEATQLLTAYASDEEQRAAKATAQAGKDRKKAAEAYRNLGAIAGLADPKRALEAYEKALALDPDDLESLRWAGYIQIEHGDLNKAQTRLERVLALAKTDDRASDKYWALTGLGDIKRTRGNLAGALKCYADSLAIAERLFESEPGNAEWQRDLSVSFDKIADVQEAQGDLQAALKTYSDSLFIAERLARYNPSNAPRQRDLAVSYFKIGGVQMAQGDLQAALKSYSDSLAIIERLAQSDPVNAVWQRDLAVAYNKIGGVQEAQGDLQAAMKSYSDSLAIFNRLAKSDPGDAEWQRDLAMSFGELALVHEQSGDRAKALDLLRQGQAVMARLTKLSPDNATWKGDLAWLDRELAALAKRQNLSQAQSRNRALILRSRREGRERRRGNDHLRDACFGLSG